MVDTLMMLRTARHLVLQRTPAPSLALFFSLALQLRASLWSNNEEGAREVLAN